MPKKLPTKNPPVTITGAKIQGRYNFWGTIIAALITAIVVSYPSIQNETKKSHSPVPTETIISEIAPTNLPCEFLSRGWKISFFSYLSGNWEIFLLNTENGDIQKLTDDPVWVGSTWSPSGNYILFTSKKDQDSYMNLYQLSPNAVDPKTSRMTPDQFDVYSPALSPDDQYIAFNDASDSDPRNVGIYVMSKDSENPKRITSWPELEAGPTWSPDSKQLAFASNHLGNWDIYTIDKDGRNLVQLSNDLSQETSPAWSPNGSTILYESTRNGFGQIFIMDINTRLSHSMSPPGVSAYSPAWSSGGTVLAYVTSNYDNLEWFINLSWADNTCLLEIPMKEFYFVNGLKFQP